MMITWKFGNEEISFELKRYENGQTGVQAWAHEDEFFSMPFGERQKATRKAGKANVVKSQGLKTEAGRTVC